MSLGNYRELPLRINGQDILIGGFKRPDDAEVFDTLKNTHYVEAIISLTGDYSELLTQANMDLAFYTHGSSVEVYDWFQTPFENTQRIPPEIYDEIYNAVEKAQKHGKKIAIHCGAGDGRTGTALASLKLRELLEEEYVNNPGNLNKKQDKSENIHMHHGVIDEGGGDVAVTPLVKQAIEEVRSLSKSTTEVGHHSSVESRNDVESLMLYEEHLRETLTLQKKTESAQQAQIEAALQASGLSGAPQTTENFTPNLFTNTVNYLWNVAKNIIGSYFKP